MADANAESLTLRCPECDARIKAPAGAIGRSLRCPRCQHAFKAAAESATPPSEAKPNEYAPHVVGDAVKFACDHCATHIKMPLGAIGKRLKCPKCATVLSVPDPNASPKPSKATDASQSADDDLFSEISEAVAAPRIAPQAVGSLCANCGGLMAPGAIVCMTCGYNTKTHKTVRTKSSSESKRSVGAALAWLGGPLVLGVIFSMIGAAIGAGVWFGVAVATAREIGYIAVLVGGLAGYGMYLGARDVSPFTGVLSAAIAVAGIVAAKVAVFAFVMYAYLSGASVAVDIERGIVASEMADEALDARGIFDEAEREKEYDKEIKAAEKRVAKMKSNEVHSRRMDYVAAQENLEEKSQLASHFSDLKAEAQGIVPGGPEWQKLYEEEMRVWRTKPKIELDAELDKLKQWNEKDKWANAAYVRAHLPYQWVTLQESKKDDEASLSGNDQASEDDWEEEEGARYKPEEWKALFEPLVAKAKRLSDADCVKESKRLEADEERRSQIWRYAYHHCNRDATIETLHYSNDRRQKLLRDRHAEASKLNDAQLRKAVADIDKWQESGQWEDAKYLRGHLIMTMANAEARADAADDDAADNPELEREIWEKRYAVAATKVDAMPQENWRAELERINDNTQKDFEKRLAEAQADSGGGGAIAGLMVAFFMTMFGPFDVILVIIAIASAYRIGANGIGSSS